MVKRIGINGFGRIGRDFLRCALARGGEVVQVVAVNDLAPVRTLAHLLRYDSTYGPLPLPVDNDEEWLTVDGHSVRVWAERQPQDIPWHEVGVDLVIESTGRFRARQDAAGHLGHGVCKVLLSAPGKGVDVTVVLGVNEDEYDPHEHHVISNASCTTNCVAPMVQVLHRTFGVVRAQMTTIHSYTNDQVLVDAPHSDLRRGRSAAISIIPTSTGAARSVGEVIPELAGRVDGVAIRVPVADGSLVDLSAQLAVPATVGQVNRAFATAAASHLKGYLRCTEDPIVSRDIIGDPSSCVFDASLTKADEHLVKVFGWYDNERGYTSRLIDLAEHVARLL
ncbi:type I glyceraldehyde-3-phosphate dehydrogenase [Kutzneria viridogrisea]|uniref:Glyceraldehyde 3-phosphate dehydrogenase n=1 Tax=Kutzneria viridogrisea TaxID=47990 RepID=A0ABR6BYP0_9PSEU|nr:glyceraldehyde 3-phosphate dehydrogenase [Kutzneria viridogrisea]